MVIETTVDCNDQARGRLRSSRRDIVALAAQLRGDALPGNAAFPRSAIMRAALAPRGRALLGAAALGMALMRPRLLVAVARLAPLTPMLRSVVNRYLVRRIFR
jgi:hypothetical protein